jgi:hypothetical protein
MVLALHVRHVNMGRVWLPTSRTVKPVGELLASREPARVFQHFPAFRRTNFRLETAHICVALAAIDLAF